MINKGLFFEDNTLVLCGIVGLDFTAEQVEEKLQSIADPNADLTVILSSPGGFIDDGFAIYDLFNQYKGTVTVRVGYQASSIASVLALGADRLIMSSTASMIIHSCNVDPMTLGDGNVTAKQVRELSDLMAHVNTRIFNAYQEVIRSKCDNPEILLKLFRNYVEDGADHPIDAQFLLDCGMCDGIESSKNFYNSTVISNLGVDLPKLETQAYANASQFMSQAGVSVLCALYSNFNQAKAVAKEGVISGINRGIMSKELERILQALDEEEKEKEKKEAKAKDDKEKDDEEVEDNEEEEEKKEKDTEEKEKEDEEQEASDEEDEEDKKTQAMRIAEYAIRAERKRVAQIKQIFGRYSNRKDAQHEMSLLMNECIDKGISIPQVKSRILDLLDHLEQEKINHHTESVNRGKSLMTSKLNALDIAKAYLFNQYTLQGECKRELFEKYNTLPQFSPEVEAVVQQASNEAFKGRDGADVFTTLLAQHNYDVVSGRKGLSALSTSDFEQISQYILTLILDTGRRYVLDEVFQLVTPRSVSTFDETKVYWNDAPAGKFDEVSEGASTPMIAGAYKEVNTKLKHFKQGIQFTFESLNKGEPSLYFMQLDNLARNALNTFRVAILETITAKAQSDGTKISGEKAINLDTLAKVVAKYDSFKDALGTPYNVKPEYGLFPANLRLLINSFYENQYKPGATNLEVNPLFKYVKPVFDAGLGDFSVKAGGSANDFYYIPAGLVQLYTFGNGFTLNAEVQVDEEKNRTLRTRLDFVVFIPRPEEIVVFETKAVK
ncbi:ATP-dependent Clp protease proteolytic subunit [Psittacicella hinzii]|uniref:ATP-dependent Clp protease proteolytic subunit n=1 Tax=Psittacicella hinzii TaxID=2028575 RepID=A0A3A1YEM8_9GAMM|nr:ATP-dependent Clp protease proteolytic subunit [Psittacicella hinzii]RIY36001.1 hypothetical protein CKF58_06340 [Psittacicella hinzii]